MFRKYIYAIVLTVVFVSSAFSQNYGVNLDTVKSSKYDMGKMWTFDYPPVDYLNETYGFKPTQEWLDNVRMAAIRFATYCSSSFVSGDGLVMTNHHCGRESVSQVEKDGEDLHNSGFLAMKLEDERPVPNLFVDQLVKITDVTAEVHSAIESGKTNEEKVANRTAKISEIEKRIAAETGLRCQVVTLYNGGLYSAYVYKRYTDVRLVFAPEDQAGFFGGDPDNFTYPRYNLDVTFFRVYDESGKPLKTEHYYKWSPGGAKVGEPIFVVGNPGRTERLNTYAQLEYRRDFSYPDVVANLDMLVTAYTDIIAKNPEKGKELNNTLFSLANSQKVYRGMVKGLNDPVIMAKKKHFEKTLREAVEKNPSLKSKYGKAWDEIAGANKEMGRIYPEIYSYSSNPRFSSVYFGAADRIVGALLKNEKVDEAKLGDIYKNFDAELDNALLKFRLNQIYKKLGKENSSVKILVGSSTPDASFETLKSQSTLGTKEGALALATKSLDELKQSNDPFIKFAIESLPKLKELQKKAEEIRNIESVNKELLGNAVYGVYGTSIPPDATFTLRISDGVMKGYDYNGTTAPPKTTFYGYYDRYYSFDKQYPWNLPERWVNAPPEFDKGTAFNFISTNDIIGGNSGSPVINKDAEIVGLAFDGNMESLVDNFIYNTDVPHTVSVASEGLMEAIKNLYKVKRLAEELRSGQLYTGQ
ncbi:MAG TPA: S46 family peptidase [Ignavibacteria bacterium]|nr:S46 family peptidase [Ignavibacteria bacterium]